MPRPLVAAFVIAAALASAACSSVPTSSTPVVVGSVPAQAAQDVIGEIEVRQQEAAPQPGAAPADIIDGFLRAAADRTAEGRTIADEYLMRSTAWDDGGDALVFSSYEQQEVERAGDPKVRRVRVTYRLLARITPEGEYRPDVRAVTEAYRLDETAGNWRIAELPRGLRIGSADLLRAYRRVVPYFYANDADPMLIPDPVYLPSSGALLTTVVEQLLKGPSPWMAPYVAGSGVFPPGTKLLSAPLTGEIAELTFSNELNRAPQADRKRIIAQLVWTLTSLTQAQITAVDVHVEGAPFVVGAEPDADARTRSRWSAYDPDGDASRRSSYINVGGYLTRYRPSAPLRAGQSLGSSSALPAVDDAEAKVAFVAPASGGRQGLTVAPIGGDVPPAATQARFMTAPSWGPKTEGVWIVRQDEKGGPQVFLVPFPADARPIEAAQLTTRVHAFEIAPDGVRVAVIYDVDGVRRTFVGLIKRDASGRALSVGGLTARPVASEVNAAKVAWADSGHLAILGRRGTEPPAVFTLAVDGSDLRLSPGSREALAGARSAQLVAPTGGELLLVVDARLVFRGDGTDWKQLSVRETK